MAEATQFAFTHRELAELLVKKQGLHEGLWQIVVGFGFGASNMGPNANELSPGAFVSVMNIGLQKATERNNLCVDAAEVNPAT